MQKTMMTTMVLATVAMALFIGKTLVSPDISYFPASENFLTTFPISGELLVALYLILIVAGSGVYAYGKLQSLTSHLLAAKKRVARTKDISLGEDSFQKKTGAEQALHPAT